MISIVISKKTLDRIQDGGHVQRRDLIEGARNETLGIEHDSDFGSVWSQARRVCSKNVFTSQFGKLIGDDDDWCYDIVSRKPLSDRKINILPVTSQGKTPKQWKDDPDAIIELDDIKVRFKTKSTDGDKPLPDDDHQSDILFDTIKKKLVKGDELLIVELKDSKTQAVKAMDCYFA